MHFENKDGKWKIQNGVSVLIEPSEEYIKARNEEILSELLNPVFKEPDISDAEIQIAYFILDTTERIEKLEGGNV